MNSKNFKISIDRVKDVSELADLLKDTEIKYTFFGAQKVSKENFNKKVSLDRIAMKAIFLIRPFVKDWNFSLQQRHHISYITKKINKFYEKMDRKRKKSNILTKIFYFIRNVFSWIFQTRKNWDILSLEIDPAIYYSTHQYKEAFRLNQLPKQPDKRYKNIDLYLKPTIVIKA